MKTFEEACLATFVRELPPGATEDDEDAAFGNILTESPRWASMAPDILNSPLAQQYVLAVIDLLVEGKTDLVSALGSAFIQGVAVGMEMERPDQPQGIAPDSVPGRREGYTGI